MHTIAPRRARNGVLLAASVFFYAWGEMRYVPLVLFSMLANYALGRACAADRPPARRKASLSASLLLNFGALLYFKYADFLLLNLGLAVYAPHVTLPLGISFYTFQTQAYVLDVYAGRVEPEPKLIDYATFILLFPQLIAGPIVLFQDVQKELKQRRITPEALEQGIGELILGLSAKVLLANPLGAMWKAACAPGIASLSMPAAWLGITAFGLQIYFDFAGYSLMAIGMGHLLGFTFPKNFDHPYASRSIREFWRRWHMTLGYWFRTYVYIPLGGSRGGALRTVRNLLIVWLLTGLWHGASWNYVLWGLWFCLFLLIERRLPTEWLARHRALAWCYTLSVVWIGWVIFAHEALPEAAAFLRRLFSFASGADWPHLLRNNAVLLALAIAACVPSIAHWANRLLRRRAAFRLPVLLSLLILCVASLVQAGFNPFLYFRF